MKLSFLAATGLLLGSTAALAQPEGAPPAGPAQDPPGPEASAPPADTPPANTPPAAAAEPASVTDADIDTFAAATLKLQEINADTSLEAQAKQQAMRAAAAEAGIEPARYNEIARAAETDPALKEKILAAVAAKRGSGDAAAPAPER